RAVPPGGGLVVSERQSGTESQESRFMRLQSRTWLGAVLATGFFTVAANAQFLETFESCAVGNVTTGPPNAACHNWQQWDSAPNVTSFVNTDVAHNGTKSVSVDSIVGGQT